LRRGRYRREPKRPLRENLAQNRQPRVTLAQQNPLREKLTQENQSP